MYSIKINGIEKQDELDEGWIKKRIISLQNDNVQICIQVRIRKDNIDMMLSSGGCSSHNSGRRPPNLEEKRIFELWEKHRLNNSEFPYGQLISFLHQVLA